MAHAPKVSVVTATHNDGAFIAHAVESILGQSFPDFEYIIVDDGSTDDTARLLGQYAAHDSRIVLLRNERRLGRAAARNVALEAARADWVAVFDGDDISHSARLACQVDFAGRHPDIDYFGTGCHLIDKATGTALTDRDFVPPQSHGLIRWLLCFTFPFHHSSTMGRRELFRRVGGYARSYPVCEDIFLWMSMAKAGARFANIGEELLTYRVNAQPHHYFLNEVVSEQLHRGHAATLLGRDVSDEIFAPILQMHAAPPDREAPLQTDRTIVEALDVLSGLYIALQRQGNFTLDDEAIIRDDLTHRMGQIIDRHATPGAAIDQIYQYGYYMYH